MLNTVILQGRIAKLNEIKLTQSQKSVLSFSLACERDFDRETTDFIPIVAFGNVADFVDKWFEKGQMILIKGRLQIREWTDKDEKRHTVTEVIAENVNFCGAKKENDDSPRTAKKPVNVNVDDHEQYSIADTSESRFIELNGEDAELPFD